MTEKPRLHLLGTQDGGPNMEEILLLYERTTGRLRTAEDIAEVRSEFLAAGLDPETGRPLSR